MQHKEKRNKKSDRTETAIPCKNCKAEDIWGKSEPIQDQQNVAQSEKSYQRTDGIRNINNEKPNAEEIKQFWSNIWDNEKEHERNAEWLRELKVEKYNMKQNDINITIEMIKRTSQKIPNSKSPGPDGV